MENNTTKRKYVKPDILPVEWDFNEAVCNTVASSPCIRIIDTEGSATRIDHRYSQSDITWNDWPGGSR